MDGYVSCVVLDPPAKTINQASSSPRVGYIVLLIRRLAGVADCKSSFVCLREGDAMPVIEASEKKERKKERLSNAPR